jgi:cardiolipin synthase A/B
LRNHRKMVVADGQRLWCGGRNLAAEYFEGTPQRGPWRDLTFDLQGPLAAQARNVFERDWAFATGAAPAPATPATTVAAPFAQVIASGPDQADDTVHDLLVTACFKARTRIAIVTPYFVPGEVLLMAFRWRRGGACPWTWSCPCAPTTRWPILCAIGRCASWRPPAGAYGAYPICCTPRPW